MQAAKTVLGGTSAVWRWGADNLLPVALAALSRSSVTHRRILVDKADYVSGRGFSTSDPRLAAWVESCNAKGESLRAVVQRAALDKCLLGNAFVEAVYDPRTARLGLYHQDATRCRLAKERTHVVLHHDWSRFRAAEAARLPIYPLFEEQPDGTLRTAIHYKDYEPMFENYGSPKYLAALNAVAIAHKTDRWNLSRLDNAFQPSGVMVLDGRVDTPEEAEQIARTAERRFAGNPGQVMFLVKNANGEADSTKFIPIDTRAEGDWRTLHQQSTEDIIVAHSWFRTLSGLEYVSGFSADRVQNEYQIALSTVIRTEQQELLEPLRAIMTDYMGWQTDSLAFVNLPPFDTKPPYMRVWEARKADGLDYNPRDAKQQLFLSQI